MLDVKLRQTLTQTRLGNPRSMVLWMWTSSTLWLCQNSYWKWPIYSWFTYQRWWFSIATLNYQRLYIYKWRTVHFHVWLPQDVLVEHVAENVSGWLNDTSPSSSFQWLWGGSPHESLFAFMWTWATTWPRCVINCIASPYIWVYWERSNRTCFFCVPPRLPADRCEAALSEDIPGSQPANLGGFRKGNTTQIKKQKPTPTGMSPTWRTRPFGFCMPFWSPQGCCHVTM